MRAVLARGLDGCPDNGSSDVWLWNQGSKMTSELEHQTRHVPGSQGQKALGAFYTDARVAEFLVWWAVRSARDTVLDPSFGGGVFLRSACRRLVELGGSPPTQVFGVEVDPSAHSRVAGELSDGFRIAARNLLCSDFFALGDQILGRFDAVVGNPPFVRYQRFGGQTRERALRCAESQSVRLTKLSSSWAPFLVHSTATLREGGRLAMVVPFEIAHAAYALPLLNYLAGSFGRVTFLTFRNRLFPHINQDTLLLVAEDRGSHPTRLFWQDLPDIASLAEIRRRGRLPMPGSRCIDARSLSEGRERLVEYFVPGEVREVYRGLKRSHLTRRLGQIADVGIGYVTGANDFFHLSPEDAKLWDIPPAFLRPAVRRGRALRGLRFTRADWRHALQTGDAGYLLCVATEAGLPEGVRRYIRNGEARGVAKAYKCRVREPWFGVPHVHRPDALLSYMSGHSPRLVANSAGAVAPNSLHILRLLPHMELGRDVLPVLWQTSLTALSVEIEGHALGGGMLKLEPTEAESVVVPWPTDGSLAVADLSAQLNELLRKGDLATARNRADSVILRDCLGLTSRECSLLRTAADTLRERRCSRRQAA